jgi:hypothetical protein
MLQQIEIHLRQHLQDGFLRTNNPPTMRTTSRPRQSDGVRQHDMTTQTSGGPVGLAVDFDVPAEQLLSNRRKVNRSISFLERMLLTAEIDDDDDDDPDTKDS